ncbi:hypothetical protein [Amaricoccus macauensis]|uniref:hypothetical protein n=1 Tax=Amaricoccus macauensis TaxID=57001 RepID=UPI003C7DBB2A
MLNEKHADRMIDAIASALENICEIHDAMRSRPDGLDKDLLARIARATPPRDPGRDALFDSPILDDLAELSAALAEAERAEELVAERCGECGYYYTQPYLTDDGEWIRSVRASVVQLRLFIQEARGLARASAIAAAVGKDLARRHD